MNQMQNLIFHNGDTMPILGLGTWKSTPGQVYGAIREAIHIGYRHFDCARIYENEEEIGVALSDAFEAGDVIREDLWITSKLWNDAHARQDVIPALQSTLSHLKLDYLDLYLVHWPIAFERESGSESNKTIYAAADKYPLAETWKGMEECETMGLARHIGVSNFSIPKLEALVRSSTIKPEMNQIELHPLLAQQSLIDYCHKQHIHVTAYAPLGSKDRSAALRRHDETDLLSHSSILDISLRSGMTPAQVLIRWSIERGTAVIPKSVHPERMQQNFESINFILGKVDMDTLANLDRHERFIDASFWVHEGSPHTIHSIWDE